MRTVNIAEHAWRLRCILNTACTLLAHQGYAATSMDQIATACRLKKASLYHYFRSKQQLLHDLIQLRLRETHPAHFNPRHGRDLQKAFFELGMKYLAGLKRRQNREFLELLVRDSFNDPFVRQVFFKAMQSRVREGTQALAGLGISGSRRRSYVMGMHQFMNALVRYALETRIWGSATAGPFQDREYIGCLAKIFACGFARL